MKPRNGLSMVSLRRVANIGFCDQKPSLALCCTDDPEYTFIVYTNLYTNLYARKMIEHNLKRRRYLSNRLTKGNKVFYTSKDSS